MAKDLYDPVKAINIVGILLFGLLPGLVSCEKETAAQPEPEPAAETPDTTAPAAIIQYLALGDSYTIGQSVPEKDRFPEQLAARLRQDSFPLGPVRIIARTGWTTDELLAAILNAGLPAAAYDMVSLLIGVNNQYRGRPLDNYRQEFAVLLERAIQLAGNRPERVLVLSIPDYGVTPFVSSREQAERIAREIDAFNAAAQEICVQRGIIFLDITPISRKAAADPSLIASDGLHPSGKMYARWVEQMLGPARRMLQ